MPEVEKSLPDNEIAKRYALPVGAVAVSAVSAVVSGVAAIEIAGSQTNGKEATAVFLGAFAVGFGSFAISLGRKIPQYIRDFREQRQLKLNEDLLAESANEQLN